MPLGTVALNTGCCSVLLIKYMVIIRDKYIKMINIETKPYYIRELI